LDGGDGLVLGLIQWLDFGPAWYDWLLPKLARHTRLLPCFVYTPPSLGVEPKTSPPPRDPKSYPDFVDVVITRRGRYFDWICSGVFRKA